MEIFCREVKPFSPLTIREIVFWLEIMEEHAVFIKLGLPNEENDLKEQADQFFNVFCDLGHHAAHINCAEEFSRVIAMAIAAVKNFFAFKRHLLHLLIECKLCGGCLQPLFIDHLSREAYYFLKLLSKLCDGDMKCQVDAMVSENLFWLRIMADHLKFMRGLLDPSERQLIDQVKLLSERYDQLNLHARDLDSMMWHFKPNNDFIRFEKEVFETTEDLQDFNIAAEQLISECAAVSEIPPLLADHVSRETEHFIEILELIRKELMDCDHPAGCCCDYDD